ncbi:MAG: hypothetical protein ACRC33_28760 [Gemmataceae bacterium]
MMEPPRPLHRAALLALAVAAAARGQYAPPADPPAASVTVRVRVPAEVTAGADVTYRIAAENASRGTAHHVQLKATLPPGVKLVRSSPVAEGEAALSWKFGTLEPGQRREVTLVVKPTADDDIDLCARVQFEHGQCVKTRVTRPGLNVRRTGPVSGIESDYPTYTLEVTNTGRATAKNVAVEEWLPEKKIDYMNSKPPATGGIPLIWELGDLAPGQTKRIEYGAILKEAGKHTIRTVLRADGVKQEKSVTVEVGSHDMDVIVAGPAIRAVSRLARYTITVRNTGTSPLTGVKMSDELPEEIVYLGSNGGRLDGQFVRWDLGTIPAGGKRTVSVEVRSRSPGTFKNVVTATADRGLSGGSNVTTLFAPAGRLAVEIDREASVASVGQELTLLVRVVNLGKANEEKIPLVVTLPDGLELIEARGPGKPEAVAGKIRFGVVDVLEPGREVTATVRVKAVREGEAKVEAAAGSAKDEGPLTVRGK